MQSKATSVAEYLSSLPPDRRAAISAIRDVIRRNLDKDYEEGMQYGMIGYYVPHRVYPAGYHCDPTQPLPFASLASQKNHMAIYLMCVYGHGPTQERFRRDWLATGRKLDMGKACIRFKRIEDVALDVLGRTIAGVPARAYIEQIESARADYAATRPLSKKSAVGRKLKTAVPKASGRSSARPAVKKSASVKRRAAATRR